MWFQSNLKLCFWSELDKWNRRPRSIKATTVVGWLWRNYRRSEHGGNSDGFDNDSVSTTFESWLTLSWPYWTIVQRGDREEGQRVFATHVSGRLDVTLGFWYNQFIFGQYSSCRPASNARAIVPNIMNHTNITCNVYFRGYDAWETDVHFPCCSFRRHFALQDCFSQWSW